jgi:flagellar hook-length control protein FliK
MTAPIALAAHQAAPHAPVAPRALADKAAQTFSSVMEAVSQSPRDAAAIEGDGRCTSDKREGAARPAASNPTRAPTDIAAPQPSLALTGLIGHAPAPPTLGPIELSQGAAPDVKPSRAERDALLPTRETGARASDPGRSLCPPLTLALAANAGVEAVRARTFLIARGPVVASFASSVARGAAFLTAPGPTAPLSMQSLAAAATKEIASPQTDAAIPIALASAPYTGARGIRARASPGANGAGGADAKSAPRQTADTPPNPPHAIAGIADPRPHHAPGDQKPQSGSPSQALPTLQPDAASGAGMFDRAIVPDALAAAPPQAGEADASAIDRASPPASPSSIANAPPVVKELDLTLSPSGLGAVGLKMRMIDGRLSVVMEVAGPDALKAAQSQREAISASLGAHAQPLDLLVIKQSETRQQQSEESNAQNSRRDARDGANSGPNGARREPFPGRRDSPRAPPPWRRADNLLV